MAIVLPGGFQITNIDPIDSRFVVADQTARLGFSAANVYEGLLVYQQDVDGLYVLTDTASYNLVAGWTALTGGSSFPYTGSAVITGSLTTIGPVNVVTTSSYQTSDFFLIRNTISTLKLNNGVEITSSAQIPLQINNAASQSLLQVSQSGVLTLTTFSVDPTGTAPNGGLYFTSADLYLGLT